MPLFPVLLITEKDEKTGYYHTHFLFFTNNLASNMKNYLNTAAENLGSWRGVRRQWYFRVAMKMKATKINWLTLFKENIAVYSENDT
jgi:hypothetical protein